MTGMEAALASGLLKVAGKKLLSLINSEFTSIMGVTKDLPELQDIHGDITSWLSVVHDRAIDSDQSLLWMIRLRNVAYDIDDLLNEVLLQAENHKIETDGDKHALADCFCANPKSFLFRCKVARKIKTIKVTFAAIVKQRNNANAIQNNLPVGHIVGSRNITTRELSLLGNVEESKIPTRDQEKSQITCKLLESNEGEDGWIVSIIGLGGSGKTTLAKHVCHDNKIKENFKDAIFWVHVSQEFDVEKLIAKLFEAIIGQKSNLHAHQHMLREISNKLGGLKFLLVLDDAWHKQRADWEQFIVHLRSGSTGSKILLTTRDRKVAEAVKSRNVFDLAFLSEAESWSLFLKSSELAEKDLDSEFVQLGKDTVNKCGGVPLAIKTVGAVLHDKREISTWKAIRDSDLWNEMSIKDRVFASLKLSYFHLADELKQCFTFCSIFPKGYEIYKDKLIAQWIAHGFISPMNGEEPEDIGSYYFDSLVKVGFLQDPSEIKITKQIVCKMHDLIHDLTRQILQDEVVTSLPTNMTTNSTGRCRYLSLTSCTENVDRGLFDRIRAIYISGGDPSFDKPIKKSRSVSSVVLHHNRYAFPLFILKFENIAYLEFHGLCKELPEAISGCWNLQALHLIYCCYLVTLPESIGKLKKLRILELEWAENLETLPESIGDCRDLQFLQLYFCDILRQIPNSLGKIENLRVLHIISCKMVKQLPSGSTGDHFSNIQTIKLAGCESLQDLPRAFTSRMLRTLDLSETKITKLPEWVTLIRTLEWIDLKDCRELVELARGIANLERLKVLCIEGCYNLRCMPPGLRQLTRLTRLGLFIVGCSEDDAMISELENLDMLSGDMKIANLQYVKDPGDAEKACLKRKNNIHNLEFDWSTSVVEEELVSDMKHDQAVLNALEPPAEVNTLKIRGYQGPSFPRWMGKESYWDGIMLKHRSPCQFLCLTDLILEELPNLNHLRGLGELPSLKTFWLHVLPNLEELWTTTSGLEIGEEAVGTRCCFPVLSDLQIKFCPKLIVKPYFPSTLETLFLMQSNEQLLSPDSWAHPVTSSSCITHSVVPHLKDLELIAMTGSSSGWGFMQHLTGLVSLEIGVCDDLTQLPESIRSLTSLRQLKIMDCPALGVLPKWLGELLSLQVLIVHWTPMISSLPQSTEHLTSLEELTIFGWENLRQLPEVFQHLTSLQLLRLEECDALTVLPECIGELSALQLLKIHKCSALQSLPSSIQRLTALQRLVIGSCPDLTKRYKRGVGDDWHLVSHIPHVWIY